jgi:hypothetical protein
MKKVVLVIIAIIGLFSCGKNYEKMVENEIIEALKTKGTYEEIDNIDVEFSKDLLPEKIMDNLIEKNKNACKLLSKYKILFDSIENIKDSIYKGNINYSDEFVTQLNEYENYVKPISLIYIDCEDKNLSNLKEFFKSVDSIAEVKEYYVTVYPKKDSKKQKESVKAYINLRTEEVSLSNFDGQDALTLTYIEEEIDNIIKFVNEKIKMAQKVLYINEQYK